MGLLEVASSKSVWRGYEYYNNSALVQRSTSRHLKLYDFEDNFLRNRF